ncbi:hypothetical protein LRAMOSA11149 [Lichtheimia ramosa]|uniref:CCHC-type domain-containing protein n=1 Tax=Lichtheimia ramosa TaxID=688394 RepID=A0A077WUG1_9FUNG|nr:hypothetical protein LRAMOSA11149 [Lichtheimia ramosa]
MTISDSVPWSQVVAKGARMRVITPARRSQNSEISTDILYEDPEFTKQQMARKAAAIVRQALTPDSVLFTVPTSAFVHRSDIYKAIESQIGPLEDVRPLSLYDVRTRRDFMIEAKFAEAVHTDAAINRGITINDVVYQASPSFVGAENPLIRVQLNLMQMGSSSTIKQGLLDSLRYYGKVYQIRRIMENGYFEGQLTITIDPSEGYVDAQGKLRDAQPLQRMLYLETWDTFAPATFKGAAPVCYYCCQAGHIRNKCPELAKRICFDCGVAGHTRKFCKSVVTDTQSIALYESAKEKQKEQELSLPNTEVSEKQLAKSDEDEKAQEFAMQTEHEQEEEDEDVPMGEDRVVDESSTKKLKAVDPEFNIFSSKHAPYDKATRMKIDEVDDMEDEVLLTKVKAAQRSTSHGKRSILKDKEYQTSSISANSSDLELRPVIPPPLHNETARRAQ